MLKTEDKVIKYQIRPWLHDEENDQPYHGDVEYESSNLADCFKFVDKQTDEIRSQYYNWDVVQLEYDNQLKIWDVLDSCNLDVAKEYLNN